MTKHVCDTCGVDVVPMPDNARGWLVLDGGDIIPRHFCSYDCLADYARLEALTLAGLPLEPPC